MAPRASCKTCESRSRAALEAARASGTSFAELARNFGLAEATIRRHFARGHARAATAPKAPTVARPAAPVPVADPGEPSVSYRKVREAARLLEIPLGQLAACVANHLDRNILTATATEEDELFAAWGEADDSDEYLEAVVRNGKFLEQTAVGSPPER